SWPGLGEEWVTAARQLGELACFGACLGGVGELGLEQGELGRRQLLGSVYLLHQLLRFGVWPLRGKEALGGRDLKGGVLLVGDRGSFGFEVLQTPARVEAVGLGEGFLQGPLGGDPCDAVDPPQHAEQENERQNDPKWAPLPEGVRLRGDGRSGG